MGTKKVVTQQAAPQLATPTQLLQGWPSKMNLARSEEEFLFGKVTPNPEQDRKELFKYNLLTDYARILAKKAKARHYQLLPQEKDTVNTVNKTIFNATNAYDLLESLLFTRGCASAQTLKDLHYHPHEKRKYKYGERFTTNEHFERFDPNLFWDIGDVLEDNLMQKVSTLPQPEARQFATDCQTLMATFMPLSNRSGDCEKLLAYKRFYHQKVGYDYNVYQKDANYHDLQGDAYFARRTFYCDGVVDELKYLAQNLHQTQTTTHCRAQ